MASGNEITLRDLRTEVLGLSQTSLAKTLGTSQSLISEIESGQSTCTVDMLSRIAESFSVHMRCEIDIEESGKIRIYPFVYLEDGMKPYLLDIKISKDELKFIAK